jgi:hypothetical protein
MSYTTMESGALTVLRLLSNYSSTNSSTGDYRILNQGVRRAVIFEPGSILNRTHHAYPRILSTTWEILISLHVNWGGSPVEAGSRIRTDRQEIMDHFDKYPTLNGVSGCIQSFIVSSRQPEMWGGENNTWWRQELILHINEHVSTTNAETA